MDEFLALTHYSTLTTAVRIHSQTFPIWKKNWHLPNFFPKTGVLHFITHFFRKSTHDSQNRIKKKILRICRYTDYIQLTSNYENRVTWGGGIRGVTIMLLCISSVCFACVSLRHSRETCFIGSRGSNATLHAVILDCRQRRCSRW